MPRYQRDGAAWFTEWLSLPQIVLGAATSAQTASTMAKGIAPRPEQMEHALSDGLDMIHAEALSFALAETMPRPEAQALVKKLCAEAQEQNTALRQLVARDHPQLDVQTLFDSRRQMGHAPDEALAFVKAVRSQSVGPV